MHYFCAESFEFSKFNPEKENIVYLALMELMGLIEHMELME
jgi:hypothetical protein